MQPGTTAHQNTLVKRGTDNLSQTKGFENPLAVERSGEWGLSGGSHSVPVSRQVSEQQNGGARSAFQRHLQRSKSVKEYIAKSTASFFGVNNETEDDSRQRWTERRRRLLSKRYGELKTDSDQPQEQESGYVEAMRPVPVLCSSAASQRLMRDMPDGRHSTASVFRTPSVSLHHRRKDSVYKMMWDGLEFLATMVQRKCSSRRRNGSNSYRQAINSYAASESDSVFYDEQDYGLPAPQQMSTAANQLADEVFFDEPVSTVTECQGQKPETLLSAQLKYMASIPPPIPEDTRPTTNTWRRPLTQLSEPTIPDVGMTRIKKQFLDGVFENSDRREYGLGVVGRLLNRKIRPDRITPDVKQQLDDIDDHRPYFTYWVTTVQVLVTIISLAVYGLGPVGIQKTQRSGLVLTTSLSLQEVDYFEPDNFWIGPRAADLVHLGAKFTPCMRKDKNIFDTIGKDRENERSTACCVHNDQSGCVQTSKDKCSEVISTWKKWDSSWPGPLRWISNPRTSGVDHNSSNRRVSGSVCGQDPRFCHEPASVYPYEWPDDITKWPVCRNVVSGQRLGEPHMSCEIIARPCCIGIYGQCHITTKEYCEFVKGFFHEEAALCSQVSCLDDVCGMIPFYNSEVPDQFYRLCTSLFLHAGIFHLLITVIIQFYIMRDVEKLAGSLRIAIIYLMSGVTGNLASAIFVPYRAEVGPAGSQFGLLSCLFVEVIHSWQMLRKPGIALLHLVGVAMFLFIIGLLPWVDNYAHIFGFIFGFLLSYALLPFVSFGTYERTTKIILIWVCLIVVIALFVGLLVLFYVHPIYECSFCKYVNCIPFTIDFCENQDIVLKRQEY